MEGGVGRAVRRARLEARLTQRALAHRANLSVGALRDLEQGRSARPRSESLVALAAALSLPSVDALLQQQPPPAVPTAPTGPDPIPPPGPTGQPGQPGQPGPTGPQPTGPTARAGAAGRPAIAVRVLGPLAVRDGPDLRSVEGRGQSLTLGLLALHVGEDVTHRALSEVLWPRGAPGSTAGLLRSYVARLRRRLTPVGVEIVSGPGRYRLVAPPDACDVSRFLADVRRADETVDAEHATTLLCEALALWPATPPLDLPELRGLAASVALERERVRAAVRCAATAVACGRPDRAEPLVVALAERDPLDESLAAAAISVLAAAGRMAEVQAVHTRTRRALVEGLGLDPGPELAGAFRDALRRSGTGPAVGAAADPPVAPDAGAGSRVPAQLPRTLRGIHGRAEELATVVDLLTAAPAAAPPVAVVSGMGGLGKTTFAVAAAHAVAGRYPDGQLFVDLDGVGEPLHPAAVLESFLVSLGLERGALPGDRDGLVAAFRTITATARCLVVLDNAATAEQVEALLPAGPGCGVLITSRRTLTELDDALHVPLAVLTAGEALELIAAGVGRGRVGSETAASEKIVALCGGLPLALRMVVARLTASPSWRIADVAEMLDDVHGRLDVLRSGSRAVRASFELSHRALPPESARLFRVAAVVPGPTFTAAATAAALGDAEVAVRGTLDDLVDRGMLGTVAGGRYRFHDLLRAFAVEQGALHAAESDRARSAVLHWLERTAREATTCVFPHRVGAVATAGPVRSPVLDDPQVRSAGAWLDREVETLAAAVVAAATDDPALAWRLADAASGAFRRATTSQEFEQAARAGLAAAEVAGDVRGTGLMCELLARAHVARCEHDAAAGWFARAADAAVAVRWAEFEVSVRENWGISLLVLGRHVEATTQFETALLRAHTTGQRYWEAACRNDLGNVAVIHGRVAVAKTHYRAALAMNEKLADALGYLVNLSNLAHAERLAGRPEVAWEHIVAVMEHPHVADDRLVLLESSIMQAEIALDLGRPAEATDLAVRAAARTTAIEHPVLTARAHLVVAWVRLAADDAATADRVGRDVLAEARRLQVPELALDAHLVLSAAAVRRHELATARQQAAAAARLAAQHDDLAGSAEALLALARVLLAEGDPVAAREEVLLAEATLRLCGHGRGLTEAAGLLVQIQDATARVS